MAVINGTATADNLTGTADADVINGLAGNDTMNGLGGNDTLQGGDGDDYLDGGTGSDLLIGGVGSDTYQIDNSADQIIENTTDAGNDIAYTGVSYTIGGGVSLDSLQATGSAAVNLTGNELVNFLIGNNADNVLDGGLNGSGLGGDVLQGGLGNDTYLVRNAGDVVQEVQQGGNDTVFVAASAGAAYALTANQEVEYLSAAVQGDTNALNLTGNGFAQTIVGNNGVNVLAGGGGNDTLVGLGGDDTYTVTTTGTSVVEAANGGNDTVNTSVSFSAGSQSIETITATANATAGASGYVLLTGSSIDQTITGSDGSDVLNGGGGNDSLAGGAGNDIYITDGGDTITDTAGTNTVISSAGITLATGLAVQQLFAAGSIRFQANGTPTTSFTSTFVPANYAYDTVDGSRNLNGENTSTASVPFLNGNEVSQLIVGNAGDNILDGNRGATTNADTLSGLAGNDTYRVYSQTDIVLEDRDGGRDTIFTSGSYSLAANDANANVLLGGVNEVRDANGNVTTAGVANPFYTIGQIEVLSTAVNGDTTNGIVLTGNAYANIIVGNFGDNTINGGGTGGSGIDVLIGLSGNDTYQVDAISTVVFEDAGRGDDTVIVSAAGSGFTLNTGTSVETLMAATGTDNIVIVGNELSQTIMGNAGNNLLSSGGGAADTLAGGAGDDTYRVTTNLDTIQETAGNGNDSLYTTGVSYRLAAGVSVEYISTTNQGGTEAISFTGNQLAQTIFGNQGDNILDSGQGAVSGTGTYGQTGDRGVGDTLGGLGGNDTYIVYSQNDIVLESAGQGTDTVRFSAGAAGSGYQLRTGTSVEALTVTNETTTSGGTTTSVGVFLYGNGGAQTVTGGAGSDTLDGRGGNDTLTGGTGNDVFSFTTTPNASTNADVITDFSAGDRIGLAGGTGNPYAGAVFTSSGTLAQTDFESVTSGSGSNGGAHVIFNSTTGQLFFDADGNGSGASVLFATVQAGAQIGFNDIILVNPVPDLA